MAKATKTAVATPTAATPAPAPKKARKGARPVAGALVGTVVASTGTQGQRYTVQGISACKVLKYMGSNGWSRKQASVVCLHLWPALSASTVGCQFYSGRALAAGNTPTHSGKPAELTPTQVSELVALCNQLTGSAPTPPAKPAKVK